TSSGPGNFSFAVPTSTSIAGSKPSGLAVGDFNGDGKPDIAAADFNSAKVYLLLNQSGSLPSFTTLTTAGTMQNLTAGDFNGDGKADLAVSSSNNNIRVLYGDGNGAFPTVENYTVGAFPRWVATGDFNGDGAPDLVTANSSDSTTSILLNQAASSGFQATPPTRPPGVGASFTATGSAQATAP